MKSYLKFVFVFALIFVMSVSSFAQVNTEEQPKLGPRKQMATIVFAGLGGAVLGLSTLSFYGRPQDHLSNIAIGFAVGIIVGTVYTTYDTAKKPPKYGYLEPQYSEGSNKIKLYEKSTPRLSLVSFSF